MSEVAEFALATLRDLSPTGSGKDPHSGLYRKSHTLFLNGHDVPDATGWKQGDQLEISNPQPYARKLEVGGAKVSIAGHVYERAAQIIRSKHGDAVDVKFVFMSLKFGNAQAQAASGISKRHTRVARAGRSRRVSGKSSPRRSGDWLSRQPAIILSAK